jgi:Ca-activated chloride channel family protein
MDIPIYSIMFGNADESELLDIANLTNAKVFDGRTDLLKAFKEVRGYN